VLRPEIFIHYYGVRDMLKTIYNIACLKGRIFITAGQPTCGWTPMIACLKGRIFRHYIVLPFRQYGCRMICRRLRYRLPAVMKILPFQAGQAVVNVIDCL
jgi:hypothetical protein